MTRWMLGLLLSIAFLGGIPGAVEAARPSAIELRGREGSLGQMVVVAVGTTGSYVPAQRLASLLKGSWTIAGARATLAVGSRSARFTRDQTRAVVSGTALTLNAPVRVGQNGWLIPDDFLAKGLARLAPGVTAARVTGEPATAAAKTVPGRPAPEGTTLAELRMRSYPSFTRVVVEAAARASYTVEPGTEEITVRIKGLRVEAPERRDLGDGLVKDLRLDPDDGDAVLRIGLDGGAGSIKDFTLQDPFRIVLDLQRPRAPVIADGGRPAGQPLRLIVLDAGHGGHDPGASGPTGLAEKEVVLDVTRRVARMIEDSSLGLKVALTRSGDVFIPLRGRTDFANRQRADLFVSIHANSHPRAVSEGVEVYFLSSEASDKEARQVAAIENGVIQLENPGSRPRGNTVKSILWDLAQSEFQQESSVLAETVLDSMTRSLRLVNRGVKQAGFYVLGGATMPAILLEIGFLTNPSEERKLASPEHRAAAARAIFAGIADYKRRYDQRMRTAQVVPVRATADSR